MLLQLWYLLTNPNPPRTFGFPPNPTICTQACSLVLPSFLDLCVDSTTLMQSREARDEACWGQFPANAGGVDCSMQVLVERSDRVSSVRSLRWTPSFVCKSGPCVLVGWATPLWGHFRRESCNFWRRLILPRLRTSDLPPKMSAHPPNNGPLLDGVRAFRLLFGFPSNCVHMSCIIYTVLCTPMCTHCYGRYPSILAPERADACSFTTAGHWSPV